MADGYVVKATKQSASGNGGPAHIYGPFQRVDAAEHLVHQLALTGKYQVVEAIPDPRPDAEV